MPPGGAALTKPASKARACAVDHQLLSVGHRRGFNADPGEWTCIGIARPPVSGFFTRLRFLANWPDGKPLKDGKHMADGSVLAAHL